MHETVLVSCWARPVQKKGWDTYMSPNPVVCIWSSPLRVHDRQTVVMAACLSTCSHCHPLWNRNRHPAMDASRVLCMLLLS